MSVSQNQGRCALRLMPVLLVPIALLAAAPWLKTAVGATATVILGGAAAIFVVSYANYISFLAQRRQDEVQKASTSFATQWGAAAGQIAFVVLLTLPPALDLATSLVRNLAGDPAAARPVVVFAMTIGFCALVLLQGIGALLVRALWWQDKR